MEHRFVLLGTESRPEIFKVPLKTTARLVNQYPDRRVAIFETLKDATMAALASIERAESRSRSRGSAYRGRVSGDGPPAIGTAPRQMASRR